MTKGCKDVPHVKKDSDIDPLRPREDFQKLVAELKRRGQQVVTACLSAQHFPLATRTSLSILRIPAYNDEFSEIRRPVETAHVRSSLAQPA